MHGRMASWQCDQKICQGNPSRASSSAACRRENHEALTLKPPLDGTTRLRMHGCIPVCHMHALCHVNYSTRTNHQSFRRLGKSPFQPKMSCGTVHWCFFLHVSPSLIWLHLHQCPSIPWGAMAVLCLTGEARFCGLVWM